MDWIAAHPVLSGAIAVVLLHFAVFRERALAAFAGYFCLAVALLGFVIAPALPYPDALFLIFIGNCMVVIAGFYFVSVFRR